MSDAAADIRKPIRRGLLEFAVLTVIGAEKAYAADILARLAPTAFASQEGTLYPLLSKLRRAGLLEHEWVESEAGPPRKYYALTAAGRAHLASLNGFWQELATTIDDLGKPVSP